MDERRQRVDQLDSFVRHRLRLYREVQNHVQRQTTNKTVALDLVRGRYVSFIPFRQIEAVVHPPPLAPADAVVVLSQRATTPLLESSPFRPNELTKRVRYSKQRLASKQLAPPSDTPSSEDTQPAGTWLNPAPAPLVRANPPQAEIYSRTSLSPLD